MRLIYTMTWDACGSSFSHAAPSTGTVWYSMKDHHTHIRSYWGWFEGRFQGINTLHNVSVFRCGSPGQSCFRQNGYEGSDLLYHHYCHCCGHWHCGGAHYSSWKRIKGWIHQDTENRAGQPSWCLPGPYQVPMRTCLSPALTATHTNKSAPTMATKLEVLIPPVIPFHTAHWDVFVVIKGFLS